MLTIATIDLAPPREWQGFEHMCWLLWREILDDPGVQKNGRSGQLQHGVDVFGLRRKGHWVGIQCKGKENYRNSRVTENELKREVARAKQFRPRLSEFVLATTGPRDSKVQACARRITSEHSRFGLFRVDVCSWDDIRDQLGCFHSVVEQCYQGAAFAKDTRPLLDAVSKVEAALNQRHREAIRAQAATLDAMMNYAEAGENGQALLSELLPDDLRTALAEFGRVRQQKSRHRATRKSSLPVVLPAARSRILGIVSVSPVPFSAASLQSLFPEFEWREALRYLRRRRLLDVIDGKYTVPTGVERSFIKNDDDRRPYVDEWLKALEPLCGHPDAAMFLSLQQMRAGLLDQSISTLVDAAYTLVPGCWNDRYLSILTAIDKPALFRRLSDEQIVHYMNSVGICLTRAGQHDRAVRYFRRLRRFSIRVRNGWGVRQSYHNCGIAHYEMGDIVSAEASLRQAVSRSRKARDHVLLGRALYHLALTVVGRSEAEATALLRHSEQVKVQSQDCTGLAAVHHGYATLAVHRGDFKDAVRQFRKAEQAARSVGDFHGQALARYNMGRACIDLGEFDRAIANVRMAKNMAKADGLQDALVLAVGAEALALERQGRYRLAEKAFRSHFELHSDASNRHGAAIALHNVGLMLIKQKKFVAARVTLRTATRIARNEKMHEWVFRSQAATGGTFASEGRTSKAINALKRFAIAQAKRGLHDIAARLWHEVLAHSIDGNSPRAKIERLFERCLNSAEKAQQGAAALKLRVHEERHRWLWRHRQYGAAIESLNAMLACAKTAGDRPTMFAAQNQIGVCLQELNRANEAVKAHRAALRLARGLKDGDSLESALNNLGEALRNARRYSDAILVFSEAEPNARARGAHECAISIAHNRALALEGQGNMAEARQVFTQCRSEARRRGLWDEYVRALHAMANLAWQRGNPREARVGYAKALDAADRYGVSRDRHQICINYANALRWAGQRELAIEVLQRAEDQFRSEPDAHIYHARLAEMYAENDDLRNAIKQWESARVAAELAGDRFTQSLSEGALAEIHEDAGRLPEASEACVSAIEHEDDPDLRLTLLSQRIQILLRQRREKAASKAFEDLERLALETKSEPARVDALLMFGDYYWYERHSPADAMKMYIAAMSARDASHWKRFVEIGAMIACRLATLEGDARRRIAAVRRTIVGWLAHEQNLPPNQQGLLLWPFSAAARLADRANNGMSAEKDEFAAIAEEELKAAVAHAG